jgi:hypothetical protein
MKEGTTLGATAQSAIQRAAVLYKPRLATFNFSTFLSNDDKYPNCGGSHVDKQYDSGTIRFDMLLEVKIKNPKYVM